MTATLAVTFRRRDEAFPDRETVKEPAVLVEMGFITNPGQEKQLQSDEFQNQIVQSLVESITRFRDAHSGSHQAGGR